MTAAETAVLKACQGGRATREIMELTGLGEGEVVDALSCLVEQGRVVGLPRSSPWFVFWARVSLRDAMALRASRKAPEQTPMAVGGVAS